jgi:SAM-dependent methyltransferase
VENTAPWIGTMLGMTTDVRAFWDEQAPTFDEEPDHGLLDPGVRAAWARLLVPIMPPAPASIADLGCGTGSLSVLLAEAGHDVRGVDLSGRMVEAAVRKARAAGVAATFEQGDAERPPHPTSSCDVVLARHVLWALPDPASALDRWTRLLRPGGLLVLVEGRWSTGAGLTAAACESLVLSVRQEAVVQGLDDPALWGRRIDDERYLLVSRR